MGRCETHINRRINERGEIKMTIRQIWKNLTRNRRVKKAIRKIKADHMKGQSKDDLDTEFGKKYNIVIGG